MLPGALAFIGLAATLLGAGVAQAKVGSNTFANPYVIPVGGTVGAITLPPTTGTSTSTTKLSTIGGSLETGEPVVPVVDANGNTIPVQGQTAWFSWTPVQTSTAVITVTSANGSAYQFQPVVAVYAFATGMTVATAVRATTYSVSPNQSVGTRSSSYAAPNQTNLALPGIFQTVVTLNATANTTYLIQVDGATTTSFPYLGQGNFTIQLQPNYPAASAPAPFFEPQSGWWYSPTIHGVGFAIEFRNSVALVDPGAFFLGAFLYDSYGNARWYVASGQLAYSLNGVAAQAATSVFPALPSVPANAYYSLPVNATTPVYLTQYANGPTLTSSAGTANFLTNAAVLNLMFTSATSGVLTVNGTSILIQRYPFTSATPTLPSTSTTATATTAPPQTGWYWNPAEPGRGFFVEQQASMLFAAAFMYRNQAITGAGLGSDVWYVTTNTMTTATTYNGRLYEYQGGDTLAGLFATPHNEVSLSVDKGAAVFTFAATATGSTTGTFSLAGRSTSVQRFNF